MKINILASSSEGNSTHIYTENTSILIDAGISAKKIIELAGTATFDAVFVSHEHSDHVQGLGALGRKTGLKIYIHEPVFNKIKNNLKNCDVELWPIGGTAKINDLEVISFSSRHDSAYSCGFIIQENTKKLAYLTDTGSWTKLMAKHMINCSGYIIEADYDYDSLMAYEEYDDYLKERISSDWGHLGNNQTVALIKHLKIKDPAFVVFAHISPRTNTPDLVLKSAFEAFPSWDKNIFYTAPTKKILEL